MAPGSGSREDAQAAEAHVERLLETYKRVHLENWASQRQEILRQKKEWRADFEHQLRQRWGEALDEYELVVEAAMLMWTDFNRRWFYPARAANDDQPDRATLALPARGAGGLGAALGRFRRRGTSPRPHHARAGGRSDVPQRIMP